MPTPPRPPLDPHAWARQRAHQLRQEAIAQAWTRLGRLLRRALPSDARAH